MPTSLFDAEFLARLGSIVVIDLLLAGDNAVVIALAVRSLPPREQFFGRMFGTVGAVVLRVALIAVATVLLRIPFMQLAGGLALIWIALKLVRPADNGEAHVHSARSLYHAIGIIVFADLVMSLDNVLGVAAAAHGDMRLVVFGIALSVPIVVWGSGLVSRLMGRFNWVVWIGGGILGYVAGEMVFADPLVARWVNGTPALAYVVSLALAAAIAAAGWWGERSRRGDVRHPAVSR
ncbi:MAG TPA: TerC family protein [Candidatus Acidoferrum sp.]|nr:TerC family protein [Candidatus Acidoferrum sp.]